MWLFIHNQQQSSLLTGSVKIEYYVVTFYQLIFATDFLQLFC